MFSKTQPWIKSRCTLRKKHDKITDVTLIFYENYYRKASVIQDFNFFKGKTVVIVSHACIHEACIHEAYIHICVQVRI